MRFGLRWGRSKMIFGHPTPFVLSEVEARYASPFDFAQGERLSSERGTL